MFLTIGCTPSSCSHLAILELARSTMPSYTLPSGPMAVTSATRAGRDALASSSSHLTMSALRGSKSDTAWNLSSPWALRTMSTAVRISSPVRGSKGCGSMSVVTATIVTSRISSEKGGLVR